MEFSEFSLKDADKLNLYLRDIGEPSCETSFVNLLIWQKPYGISYALKDGALIIKNKFRNEDIFYLPFADDFIGAFKSIQDYCDKEAPVFWTPEGSRLEKFKTLFGDRYEFIEQDEGCDYMYLRESLAYLTGKRYHSKRNHISAFSKKFDWHYESISESNIEKVIVCEEQWYREYSDRLDGTINYEKHGFDIMIRNMDMLDIKGGAIFVGDKIVAYTLGSPINDEVFDIHIEKALGEYAKAYSVINREFALNELSGYKYINREDDLGIEGLKKAKLSYHPERLLKKYVCEPKV